MWGIREEEQRCGCGGGIGMEGKETSGLKGREGTGEDGNER